MPTRSRFWKTKFRLEYKHEVRCFKANADPTACFEMRCEVIGNPHGVFFPLLKEPYHFSDIRQSHVSTGPLKLHHSAI